MTQFAKRYLYVYSILLTLGPLTFAGCAQELTDPNANTQFSNLSGDDEVDEDLGDYEEPCGEEPSCEDNVLAICTDPETGELDECCYDELIEGCYEETSCEDLANEECTDPETGELDEECVDEILEWCEGEEEMGCEDIAFEECFDFELEELDEGCVDEILEWCEGEYDEWDELLAFCEEIAIGEAEAECINEDGELDEGCFEELAAELFDACVSDTEESLWFEQEIIAYCEEVATDTGFEYCTDEEGYVDVDCFEAVRDDAFSVCLEEVEAEMGDDDARWEAILDACVGLAEDLVIVFCEPEDEGCFEETFDAIVNECLAEAGAALEEEDIYEDIHESCSALAEEAARVDACAELADEVAMDECAYEEDVDPECYDEVALAVFDDCLGVEACPPEEVCE